MGTRDSTGLTIWMILKLFIMLCSADSQDTMKWKVCCYSAFVILLILLSILLLLFYERKILSLSETGWSINSPVTHYKLITTWSWCSEVRHIDAHPGSEMNCFALSSLTYWSLYKVVYYKQAPNRPGEEWWGEGRAMSFYLHAVLDFTTHGPSHMLRANTRKRRITFHYNTPLRQRG